MSAMAVPLGSGPIRQGFLGRLSTSLYLRPRLALILLLLPPLLWLGIVYIGSLLALLAQSFFSVDDFSGLTVYQPTLATYAESVIGKLPVQAIDTALVLKVLEPIWTEKPETANRVRGRLESWILAASARLCRSW